MGLVTASNPKGHRRLADMTGACESPEQEVLQWSDAALELSIEVDGLGRARLRRLAPLGVGEPSLVREVTGGSPLVDILLRGHGRGWSGGRYSESLVGSRMRYVGDARRVEGPWAELSVELEDPVTGLEATMTYRFLLDNGVVRSWVRLRNGGVTALVVESVSSFLGNGVAGPGGELADVDVLWAENDWQAEGRWQARRLDDALPPLTSGARSGRSRGRFALTGVGTWSSGGHLPMGALVNRRTGHTLLWQIEHNGAWHWQVGERAARGSAASYVALLGPTDAEHQWSTTLLPGESFESVPVALALTQEGFEDAVARLTRHRRALRRKHADHRRLPVIFNDYLNTLNADPTTERLLPLVRAAARAGAECFCIDAGWYAGRDEVWWDTMGAWVPSNERFPGGLKAVTECIRQQGMIPGLWIEPEVVGARSPVARQLPDEAFFSRSGARIFEQDRYQLDLRHPAARAHLDQVVDSLVRELGLGYLKMDYNVNIAPGTDVGGLTPGAGLLGHSRAFLAWVDGLLDRHRHLTIESCASGGMRTDYAMLSHFQLQSTSDQEDPLLYPPIVAASPVAVAPEQAAVWAPPQPEMDDDLIAFSLCNAMLGRVHLSGHLDSMSSAQQDLVAQAVGLYKQMRADLASAVPFWPLGLPGWTDPWIALGMRAPGATYLALWRRNEAPGGDSISLPVTAPGTEASPRLLFPTPGRVAFAWDTPGGRLHLTMSHVPSSCIVAFDGELPAPVRRTVLRTRPASTI